MATIKKNSLLWNRKKNVSQDSLKLSHFTMSQIHSSALIFLKRFKEKTNKLEKCRIHVKLTPFPYSNIFNLTIKSNLFS